MKITAIKTHQITTRKQNLISLLIQYLPKLSEGSIVVITSKIVSICEGRTLSKRKVDKMKLIVSEADRVLGSDNKAGYVITIKNGVLMPTAGIDPAPDHYVLHPKDSQKTAVKVARLLRQKFTLQKLGVLITDSKSVVLQRGTMGYALGYSGFCGLKNYNLPGDVFRKTTPRKHLANQVDSLAAAAVMVMGEKNEQTPIAIVEDIPFITFGVDLPTKLEQSLLRVKPSDDLFLSSLVNLGKKKTK